MKDFTLRKRFLDSKSGTSSLFKGFVMLVVLMLMTTSSAMAQEAKFEVIDGAFKGVIGRVARWQGQQRVGVVVDDLVTVVTAYIPSAFLAILC